jgi:hypothetical protein
VGSPQRGFGNGLWPFLKVRLIGHRKDYNKITKGKEKEIKK